MRVYLIAAIVALLAISGCEGALNASVPVDASEAARDARLTKAIKALRRDQREVAERYMSRRQMESSLAIKFSLPRDLPREGLTLDEAIDDQRRYEQASSQLTSRRDIARGDAQGSP